MCRSKSRQSLERYLQLQPVIDGVEGTFTKTDGLDASQVKLIGNVPASGKAPGGTAAPQGMEGREGRSAAQPPPGNVLAPAEIEVE